MPNYNDNYRSPRPGNQPQGGGFRKRDNNEPKQNADSKFKELSFDPSWITKEATPSLVEYAENAGRLMAKNGLTNTKIRSIFGEIKRIQMGEFEKEKPSFYLLKPKVAYTLGRDKNNEGLKLFKNIFDMASASVTDQKSYQNFCNLMEAILAYHKAYGGKD